jgi:cingulin
MQERSARQDLECDKISLERQVKERRLWGISLGRRPNGVLTLEASHFSQNKDLKTRLASSEGFQKPSASLSQLESQNQLLQERLQAEER